MMSLSPVATAWAGALMAEHLRAKASSLGGRGVGTGGRWQGGKPTGRDTLEEPFAIDVADKL